MELSQPQATGETKILTSNHIQSLWVSKGIADTIIVECNKSPDFNHCVKSVLGVANAESWLFANCSTTKNCHGVMERINGQRRLKRFTTYEEGVKDRIQRYIRNKRYVRLTATDRIDKWGYCNRNEGDWCVYWGSHYTAIALKIDEMF